MTSYYNITSMMLTAHLSSPERFLSWDRTGHCQFRPIKGTVKKSDFTRKEAYEILESSKEQAENLMIVDLIRQCVLPVPQLPIG